MDVQRNLSIIIPVSKDRRIANCLNSIRESVEIIVVLNNNPSREVQEIVLKDPRCRNVLIPEKGCNLSHIFNMGIHTASHDRVLLMNSDCIVPEGLIEQIARNLNDYEVVKARISFSYNSYTTWLVAQTRWLFHHCFNQGKNLFGPGLAFRKSIITHIGGTFFNERLPWGEDGDLSKRIHKAGLSIYFLEDELQHDPEGIIHDLIMAYRIGSGERTSDAILGISKCKAFKTDIIHLFADSRGRFRTAFRHAGFQITIYFLIWKVIFHLGYYLKRYKSYEETKNHY